jgi:hypothetical protein
MLLWLLLLQTLEIKVTVGKRAEPNPFVVPFDPPAPLEPGTASAEEVKKAVARGLKVLVQSQQADGSWVFDPDTQIPQGTDRLMLPVARSSLTPVVLTSLACMALRAHDAEAAAVEKGRAFVVARLGEQPKKDYAIWTWAFTVTFLAEEFRRTKDPALREAAAKAVEKILADQRPGMADAPELPARKERAAPSWSEPFSKSRGGTIEADPARERNAKGGVLIQRVVRGGAADRAGLQAGDRVAEIDGQPIYTSGEFFDRINVLQPGTQVTLKVVRGAPPNDAEKDEVRDGGWAYYSWADSMSFMTATALLALFDARDMGIDVPQAAIDRGLRAIESMKFEQGGEVGYRYRTYGLHGYHIDIRSSIGRVAVCALALKRGGREADVEEAGRLFLRRRGELDRVRGYPGSHLVRLYGNTAYYFLYAHYYASRIVNVSDVLLRIQRDDGSWTDHPCWGTVYGTAMALMSLH